MLVINRTSLCIIGDTNIVIFIVIVPLLRNMSCFRSKMGCKCCFMFYLREDRKQHFSQLKAHMMRDHLRRAVCFSSKTKLSVKGIR